MKSKNWTAALAWHGASPWIQAVSRGARDTFERHGVRVLASTDAQYDPARQVADLENIAALRPDLLLSLIIDGVSARGSLQKIIDKGSALVLLSNPVPGFQHGRDFAGIVTDDMQGMGREAARGLAALLQGKGRVGLIFHDANYFITNTRDQAFVDELKRFPGLQLVDKRGFVKEADTHAVAAAMLLRHRDLDAIYVSWDTAAEGVIEALRADGHRRVKVVSHDLGVNNLLDMAVSGNMALSIADRPYAIGATMARVALRARLGQPAPLFTLVPFDAVTRDNIAAVWQQAYQSPVPAVLQNTLSRK